MNEVMSALQMLKLSVYLVNYHGDHRGLLHTIISLHSQAMYTCHGSPLIAIATA